MDRADKSNDQAQAKANAGALESVAGALERLRYGAVLLTVHEGKVVQIDVTERRRFS